MKNKNFSLNFAIAGGKKSEEASEFKQYVGIATCKCRTINPTKDELSKILGREYTKDLVYTKKNDDGIDMASLLFPIEVSVDENTKFVVLHRINVINSARYNKDRTKIQVVDEYGTFAWASIEDFKAKNRPMNSNGPAKCTTNYRYAYQGEEQLTNFLKARICIESPWKYENQQWVIPQGDHSDCMARLDNIANLFKGDVSEIKNAFSYFPENELKLVIYLRPYNNNMYHDVFYRGEECYMKNNVYKYNRLETTINQYKEQNPECVIECKPIHEYKLTATDFTANNNAAIPSFEDPFAEPAKAQEQVSVKIDDDLPF